MIRIDCDDVRVVQLAQGTNLSEQSEGCYLACERELTQTPEPVGYVLDQRLRIPDSNLLIFFFNIIVKQNYEAKRAGALSLLVIA